MTESNAAQIVEMDWEQDAEGSTASGCKAYEMVVVDVPESFAQAMLEYEAGDLLDLDDVLGQEPESNL